MAIAFYCEDDDPKVLHGSQSYYAAYGYNSYQQQQAAVVEHHPQQSQQQAGGEVGLASAVVDGNNNSNCALHGSGTINTEDGSNSDASVADATASSSSKQALMQVLHQVLYRYTMEGALSPAHTSCVFCNKIYYLFQLLY